MKYVKQIVFASMLAASSQTFAQTTETVPTPMGRNIDDDDGDNSKWALAGLLGLLGLLGLRPKREDHRTGPASTNH